MGEALHLELFDVLFYLANFAILVGVLTKFLYKPYLDMMDARKKTIHDAFDEAEATNRKADEKMEEYSKKIANVEDESREIIKNAKMRAEAQANDIIEEANEEAMKIKLQAEKEVEREKAKAMAEMKAQVASLALLVAEKVLEQDIEDKGQDFLIDDIVGKVGNAKWQN